MDIYEYLKKDHQTIMSLFDKFLSTHDREAREALFNLIALELLIHDETEKATFYEALKQYETTKMPIHHNDEEHNEIKKFLARLVQYPINANEWMNNFHRLKAMVAHHVMEEEGDVFETAQQVLTKGQAQMLARDMDQLKSEVRKRFFSDDES